VLQFLSPYGEILLDSPIMNLNYPRRTKLFSFRHPRYSPSPEVRDQVRILSVGQGGLRMTPIFCRRGTKSQLSLRHALKVQSPFRVFLPTLSACPNSPRCGEASLASVKVSPQEVSSFFIFLFPLHLAQCLVY